MRALLFVLLTAVLMFPATAAWAQCANPAGTEGDFIYNQDYKTLQFCDGTAWVRMGGTFSESDPEVGDISTSGKTCRTDGTKIICDKDAGQLIDSGSGAAPNFFILDDIDDVNAPTPGDAQFLKYDSATGNWIAAPVPIGQGGKWLDGIGAGEIYYSSGNVGIFATDPATALDVGGTIRMADGGEVCDAAHTGAIRFISASFQICRDPGVGWEPLVGAGAGGVCDSTQTYASPGTFSYTVPDDFATMNIKIWSGGGGGGGVASGSPTDGGNGGTSSIVSLGLSATGGIGGLGALTNTPAGVTGGAGGTASGGDININGNAGSDGAESSFGGNGGNAPGGGGSGGNGGSNSNGVAGSAPGGGGGGGGGTNGEAGGAGSGAYVEKTYTTVSLTPSTVISDIVVGAGGANGTGNERPGGAGAVGRVSITCSTGGVTPPNERQIVFISGGAFAGDASFIFSSTGRMGLGTAAPTTELEVAGSTKANSMMLSMVTGASAPALGSTAAGGSGEVQYNSGGALASSGAFFWDNVTTSLGIGTGTPNDGKVEVKGGTVCVDTDNDGNATSCITAESDLRLKKNVREIQNGLDIVMALRGVQFDWRWDEYGQIRRYQARPHAVGVVAQDVAKVLPEALGEDIGGYMSVEYRALIPPLIEAVKEQQAIIQGLEARIEKLERENAGPTVREQ